jgi:hypothetical protein
VLFFFVSTLRTLGCYLGEQNPIGWPHTVLFGLIHCRGPEARVLPRVYLCGWFNCV